MLHNFRQIIQIADRSARRLRASLGVQSSVRNKFRNKEEEKVNGVTSSSDLMDWMIARSASGRGGAGIETRCAVVVAAGMEMGKRELGWEIVTIGWELGWEIVTIGWRRGRKSSGF
jgi:hypothetical protein